MDYSSVTMTDSQIVQSQVAIDPSPGDVVGLQVSLSVLATGTLTSATPVLDAIQNLSIVDNTGATLVNLSGSDLDQISFWLSPNGVYTTVPDNSSSAAAEWHAIIPVQIATAHQTAKAQLTIAPYSALASSGATGGTFTCSVNAIYGTATGTTMISRRQLSVVSGDNSFGTQLSNMKTDLLGFVISSGTEANINNVTFSPDGSVSVYNSQALEVFEDEDTEFLQSGHQTGVFNLYVNSFTYSTSSSVLNFNAASSDTLYIYQIGVI